MNKSQRVEKARCYDCWKNTELLQQSEKRPPSAFTFSPISMPSQAQKPYRHRNGQSTGFMPRPPRRRHDASGTSVRQMRPILGP